MKRIVQIIHKVGKKFLSVLGLVQTTDRQTFHDVVARKRNRFSHLALLQYTIHSRKSQCRVLYPHLRCAALCVVLRNHFGAAECRVQRVQSSKVKDLARPRAGSAGYMMDPVRPRQ